MALNRSVLRYPGGKWRIAPWIIEHMPKHKVYVEPFGGGASVLLRKPRSAHEVYNDLDGDVVNYFRVLRDPEKAADLARLIELTPFARDEYYDCMDPAPNAGDVERARRMAVRCYMGIGSESIRARRLAGFDVRTGGPSAFSRLPEALFAAHERLKNAVIENMDAIRLIEVTDSPETLFFVDPPYVKAARNSKNMYANEMDDDAHFLLVKTLQDAKGMILLSGYESEIYSAALEGWRVVTTGNFTQNSKRKTVEHLWINPAASALLKQIKMDF